MLLKEFPGRNLGSHVWPSSRLLAHAIVLQTNGLANYELPSIENCNVLELGAGCGLSGLVAAKCGAAKVCLTEKIDLIDLLEQEVLINDLFRYAGILKMRL